MRLTFAEFERTVFHEFHDSCVKRVIVLSTIDRNNDGTFTARTAEWFENTDGTFDTDGVILRNTNENHRKFVEAVIGRLESDRRNLEDFIDNADGNTVEMDI